MLWSLVVSVVGITRRVLVVGIASDVSVRGKAGPCEQGVVRRRRWSEQLDWQLPGLLALGVLTCLPLPSEAQGIR